MTAQSRSVDVVTCEGEVATRRRDFVAVEEPLEIHLNGGPLVVTMRTPGEDEDLAAGYLFTEGIIRDASTIGFSTVGDVLDVTAPGAGPAPSRGSWANSACGACGKSRIEDIAVPSGCTLAELRGAWRAEVLTGLADALRGSQKGFDASGGLHAAGLFDVNGELLAIREDVGRHNAVDKVIGHALRTGLDLSATLIFVSGRAGFELIQKSVMAGLPALAAVGAPTSLSVATAKRYGQTLIGFVRGARFNVYAGEWRVTVTGTNLDAG